MALHYYHEYALNFRVFDIKDDATVYYQKFSTLRAQIKGMGGRLHCDDSNIFADDN